MLELFQKNKSDYLSLSINLTSLLEYLLLILTVPRNLDLRSLVTARDWNQY